MAEQYKDTHQNKYREETAQIHAPISLIVKTKAAVREEEKRLAQTARVCSMRKWAYPLTAAAAILILVSVSLTMRGLKSTDRMPASDTAYSGAAASDAVCEEAVESADAGCEEGAVEAPADSAFAEAPASETPVMEAESVENLFAGAAADTAETDSVSEAQNEDGAASAGAGQTNGLSREDVMADSAAPAGEEAAAAENAECERTDGAANPAAKEEEAVKKQAVSELKGKYADSDEYTLEKVTKRPVRFNGSDVKIRRYEGKTFRVLEAASAGNQAEKSWEAYVETAAGAGYVICGEAESMEDFLAAAHTKLEEEE